MKSLLSRICLHSGLHNFSPIKPWLAGALLALGVISPLRASTSGAISWLGPTTVGLNETIYANAWAVDEQASGVSDVKFFVDGNLSWTGYWAQYDGSEWIVSIPASGLGPGDHTITAYGDASWDDDITGWHSDFWQLDNVYTVHVNNSSQCTNPTVSADQTIVTAGDSGTTLHVTAQANHLRYVNLGEISGPGAGGSFGTGNNFDAASPPNNGWNDLNSDVNGSYTRNIALTFSVPGTYTFAGAMMDDAGNSTTYSSTGGNLPTVTITVLQTQSITFNSPGNQPNGSVITLNATASSGLPVSYTVSGPASLSGSTLTLTGIGSVTVTASQGGNGAYAAAANKSVTFSSLNRAPVTTISATAPSVIFGQPMSVTATTTDADGNLVSQLIEYSINAGSTWTNAASWSGSQTASHGLTWAVPGVNTWQIRASGGDGSVTSSYASVSVTVTKATPLVSNWSDNRGIASSAGYSVTTADLGAIFSNPYSGSVASPTGTVTYSIISGGSGSVINGTTLQPGSYTIRASYPGDGNYNSTTADVTWTINNPVTTISTSAANVASGQGVTITAISAESGGGLTQQVIDYLPPGASAWVSGLTVSGANWSGGATSTHTLTWAVPAATFNVFGTWQFRASCSDGTAVSNTPSVSVVYVKATPAVSNWTNHTFSSNSYTVSGADLGAVFINPTSSSAAQPTGTVTYSFVPNTSNPIAVQTVLMPGVYTVRASYPGDTNYTPAVADVTWTINSFINPNGDSDGDGIPDSSETSGQANVYNTATNDVGMKVPAGWPRLAAADTTSSHKDNAVGITTGQFSVDNSGAATYSIPLYACPGTAGMEPKLSLGYSSQGGAGILGFGWSLSGVSVITRGPQTRAIDGQVHGVDFSAADRFYLDGQRLIAINNGTYGANGTEYRTEMDSFSRIISYGVRGSGPAYFKVWTKAGLIIEFGNTSDSAFTPNGRSETLAWSANKVSDTKGNYMTFAYSTNTTAPTTPPTPLTGEQLLTEIDYTGNNNASPAVQPYNSVRFAYENRPDTGIGYIFGAQVSRTQRLKHIQAYSGSTLVRDYVMDYTPQANTHAHRSLLAGLQEVGSDGKAYPELTFNYSDPGPGFDQSQSSTWAPPMPLAINNAAPQGTGFVDLNGDGRPDFVQSHTWLSWDLSTWSWDREAWLNTPNGWVKADGTNNQPDYRPPLSLSDDAALNGQHLATRFVDLNGDGRPDLFTTDNIAPNSYNIHGGDGGTTGYGIAAVNTGSGWASSNRWSLPMPPKPSADVNGTITFESFGREEVQFVDINGDGLPDCLCWTVYEVSWEQGQASGTSEAIAVDAWINKGPPAPNEANPDAVGAGWVAAPQYQLPFAIGSRGGIFMDVNGDGLPDLVRYFQSADFGTYRQIAMNTGSGWQILDATHNQADYYVYAPPVLLNNALSNGTLLPVGTEAVDLNGDGLPDLIVHNDSINMAYFSTGHGWLQTPSSYFGPASMWNSGAMKSAGSAIMDIDGDGQPDFIHANSDDSSNSVWLGTGTGWTSSPADAAYNIPRQLTGSSIPPGSTDLVDLKGDGALDEIWNSQDSSGAAFNQRINVDRLVKITTGMGVATTIAYKPLTDPSVYTKGSGATYPESDVIGPMYVVSEVDNDDGTGGQYPIYYNYGQLRSNVLHGSEGFGVMSVTDGRTGIKTVTNFRQDYPFIGMISYTATSQPNGQTLSATNTFWNDQNSSGPVHFPYASPVLQQSYELDGTYISGAATLTSYDNYGNATGVAVGSLNAAGSLTGYSKVTTNTYTNDTSNWLLGRLVTSQVTASAPNTPSITRNSSFVYDSVSGLLTQESVEPGNSALGLTTTYVYDAFGNKISATVFGTGFANRTTTTTYDLRGQFPVSTSNPLGHAETYVYDAKWGVMASQTGPNGLRTTWSYDGMGRKIEEDRPDGTMTKVNYRWAGAAAPVAPAGSVTSYLIETETSGGPPSLAFYDNFGRGIYAFGLNGGDFDGNPRIVGTQTQYDNMGRAFWNSLPFYYGNTPQVGNAVTGYDLLNRPTAQAALDEEATNTGGVASTTIAYFGQYTQATNTLLQITQTINPLGQITQIKKNSEGQVVSVITNLNATAAIDRGETDYTYDAYGNVLTTSVVKNGGSPVATSFTYDPYGRKTQMVDPDMGTWTYAYDAAGELTSQTDAKGQITTMVYDVLGRLVGRAEGTGGADTTTWIYDITPRGSSDHWLGKLSGIIAPGGYSEYYAYDNLGRPITTYRVITTDLVHNTSETFPVGQAYDNLGRPTVTTYPYGYQVKTVYSDYGLPKEVRQASASTGLVNDTAQDQLFWQADSYSIWGGINGVTYGNGTTEDTIFAATTGRVEGFGIGVNTSVANYVYSHDALGNLTLRTDYATGRSESYTYDGLNRLTGSALTVSTGGLGTSKTVTVGYDSLGNITTKSDVGTYTYGQNNAGPHAVTAAGGNSYTYDADGNMLSGAGRNLQWTAFNQIKHIDQGSHHSDFTFDANHQRVTQTTEHGTTVYVGSAFERITSSSGAIDLKFYIFTPAGRSAVHTIHLTAGTVETRYFHQDSLGSIVAVTDETGAVAERYAYDPWGNQTSLISHSSTATTRGFTDHEMLTDLGLIHMNGRVYDPVLGRFLSADPHVQDAADSQSYNRYSYLTNNPLDGTDPTGFFKLSLKSIVTLVVVAVIAYFTAGAAIAAWGAEGGAVGAAGAAGAGGLAGGVGGTVVVGSAVANSAFAGALLSAGMSAATVNGIIGGLAAGFASGFAGSLLNGGSIGDAFRAGLIGGAVGAVTGGLSGQLSGDGIFRPMQDVAQGYEKGGLPLALGNLGRDAEAQAQAYGARVVMKKIAQKLDVSLTELNLALTALSFAGDQLLGDRINQLNTKDGSGSMAGFRSRDYQNALGIFQDRDLNKNVGMVFDSVDTLLTYQGLPSGSGWKAILDHDAQNIKIGHSLGASEVATLRMWGAVGNVEADALPFGRIAPAGVDVHIGNGDAINGFSMGGITNPWAKVVNVPWFAHSYHPNYDSN